jgi:hypothetical protein
LHCTRSIWTADPSHAPTPHASRQSSCELSRSRLNTQDVEPCEKLEKLPVSRATVQFGKAFEQRRALVPCVNLPPGVGKHARTKSEPLRSWRPRDGITTAVITVGDTVAASSTEGLSAGIAKASPSLWGTSLRDAPRVPVVIHAATARWHARPA